MYFFIFRLKISNLKVKKNENLIFELITQSETLYFLISG